MATIDLFCGAGGITEGFRQSGFDCLYANDFNKEALETFRLNHPGIATSNDPIERLDPLEIRQQLQLERGELEVLVGGPPCQGFSINAPERFAHDPRNAMFLHYMRFLEEFAPKRFLFENVPGMLSMGNGRIFNQILHEFQIRGYRTTACILLAAHYGVPQIRWRLIILGTNGNQPLQPPQPTHFCAARANFTGGRTMIIRQVPADAHNLPAAVNLRAAIGDLPRLKVGQGQDVSRYTRQADSEYSVLMRGANNELCNHVANRIAPINLERLRHIPQGGNWTDIPFDLLPAGMKRARRSDHTKRYGRLTWNNVAGTMLTKCDPHWGAVFHPDQDRTFTVREAARIQSFPDSYRFLGSRVSQYEQVGNAVPVLMARAIGEVVMESLGHELPAHHP